MDLGVLGLGSYDMLFTMLSSLVVFNNCMGVFECCLDNIASGASETLFLTPYFGLHAGSMKLTKTHIFLKNGWRLFSSPHLKTKLQLKSLYAA